MSRWLAAVLGAAIAAACGAGWVHRLGQAADADAPPSILIQNVPHVRQKPGFSGEACAAMALRKAGLSVGQDDVFNQSGVDPIHGRGCNESELADVLARIGFRTGPGLYPIDPAKADEQFRQHWEALREDLARGVPSIVPLQDAGSGAFRLVLGHDGPTDEVVLHDPSITKGAHRRMKRGEFLKRWFPTPAASGTPLCRIRLEATNLAVRPRPAGFTNADYAQHIMELLKKVPAKGFTIVIERPFVVVGDGRPEDVRDRARHTVRWAVDMLKQDYFTKDPVDILDIWLFEGAAGFRRHAWSIFGDKPDTPYGYYSSRHKALIMNIATGGGTLVHEIVHPFVAASFPACPAWLNEGLASLYEQCGQRQGHIHGYTNWRLEGLQQAIGKQAVLPLKELLAMTERQFYGSGSGVHYAQARYLCYYLQQQGLLVKFYHAFAAAAGQDPSGYETLKTILGEKDMHDFQKRWEAWVMKLRFP